jgi:hypothetical protein
MEDIRDVVQDCANVLRELSHLLVSNLTYIVSSTWTDYVIRQVSFFRSTRATVTLNDVGPRRLCPPTHLHLDTLLSHEPAVNDLPVFVLVRPLQLKQLLAIIPHADTSIVSYLQKQVECGNKLINLHHSKPLTQTDSVTSAEGQVCLPHGLPPCLNVLYFLAIFGQPSLRAKQWKP